MTAPVAQFENRLSSNADAPHSHDHGDGHAGHSHDQAAEEHGHTHEHMEHAGEYHPSLPVYSPGIQR